MFRLDHHAYRLEIADPCLRPFLPLASFACRAPDLLPINAEDLCRGTGCNAPVSGVWRMSDTLRNQSKVPTELVVRSRHDL
jgi:hypothetical protein